MNQRHVAFYSFVLALIVLFAGCSRREELDPVTETENVQIVPASTPRETAPPTHNYVGDYENDPMYQALLTISSCCDPDEMVSLLSELYGSEIYLVKLMAEEKTNEYGTKYIGYAAPYENILCQGIGLYNPAVRRVPIEGDTYLFLEHFNEVPIFMMTADGKYIVTSYEIKNYENGTTSHWISGFEIFDLFFTAHGYIEETHEEKAFLRDATYAIEEYAKFEENVYNFILNTERPSEEHNFETLPFSMNVIDMDSKIAFAKASGYVISVHPDNIRHFNVPLKEGQSLYYDSDIGDYYIVENNIVVGYMKYDGRVTRDMSMKQYFPTDDCYYTAPKIAWDNHYAYCCWKTQNCYIILGAVGIEPSADLSNYYNWPTTNYLLIKDLSQFTFSDQYFGTASAPVAEDVTQQVLSTPEPASNSPSTQIINIPYTISISGTTSIYAGPGYEFAYVQDVGQDGVYTIVEESWDAYGNLWGRLKSGVGWVNLNEFYF